MTKTLRLSIQLATLALSAFVVPALAQEAPAAAAQAAAPDPAVEDALLALEVKTALLDKIGWEATRVEVTAKTGTVWLTGKVKARSVIGTAEEIAKATPGVKVVRNVLELEQSTEKSSVTRAVEHAQQEVDDAVLESRVKGQLLQQMGKVGFSVEVEANSGIVTLTGKVPDELRHQLAVQTATAVSGVEKLVDLLKLP
jgi:osmotically-inducible protein OsmY